MPDLNLSQIEVALEIAMKAHKGQRDLDGNHVILHSLTVALMGHNESEIVAGLLHDVVEDTDWTFTFDDLLEAGIKPEVVDALRLLTHRKDLPYLDYVRRIADSHNPTAINVKCNDLEHNLDRGRRGDHLKQVAKHTAAKQIIHRNNGDEDATWCLLMEVSSGKPNSRSKLRRSLSQRLPPKQVSPLTSRCDSFIPTAKLIDRRKPVSADTHSIPELQIIIT